MKKFLLTLALILALPVLAFGHASVPSFLPVNPDIVVPDNDSWAGTHDYNGKIGIFNSSTIAFNRNYVNKIQAFSYKNPVQVRVTLGDFKNVPPCPNLPPAFHGKIGRVAYKTFADQRKVWVLSNVSNLPKPIVVEQNGLRVNPANFPGHFQTGISDPIQPNPYTSEGFLNSTVENQACYNGKIGFYPQWRLLFDIYMTPAEFAVFKADILASDYASQFSETSTAPSGDGGR